MSITKTYSIYNYYNILVILSHGLWITKRTLKFLIVWWSWPGSHFQAICSPMETFFTERSRVTDRATMSDVQPPKRSAYSSCTALMTTITRSYRTRGKDRYYHCRSMVWGTPTLRCRNYASMATDAHRDIFRDSRRSRWARSMA